MEDGNNEYRFFPLKSSLNCKKCFSTLQITHYPEKQSNGISLSATCPKCGTIYVDTNHFPVGSNFVYMSVLNHFFNHEISRLAKELHISPKEIKWDSSGQFKVCTKKSVPSVSTKTKTHHVSQKPVQTPYVFPNCFAVLSSSTETQCPYHPDIPLSSISLLGASVDNGLITQYTCPSCKRNFITKADYFRLLPKLKSKGLVLPKLKTNISSTLSNNNNQETETNILFGIDFNSIDFHKNEVFSIPQRFPDELVRFHLLINGESHTISVSSETNSKKMLPYHNAFAVKLLSKVCIKDTENEFAYSNHTIKILQYKQFPNSRLYIDTIRKFLDVTSPQTVYIVHSATLQKQKDFIPVTALIPCVGKVEPYRMNIFYSKSKHYYCISESSYQSYFKIIGANNIPYIKLRHEEGSYSSELRNESDLHLYGYSVNQQYGLTLSERRTILKQLLDYQIMEKSDIICFLEWLLRFQGKKEKMKNACSCWQEDRDFVANYNVQNQHKIWFSQFKHS